VVPELLIKVVRCSAVAANQLREPRFSHAEGIRIAIQRIRDSNQTK
jgi:hypothetical protein